MDGTSKVPVETQTPGIDITLTGNFGGDRQMAVRTMLLQNTAEAEAHDIVDRVFRVFDRQKARYELVDLAEELRKNKQALARFTEDMPAVEANHKKEQAARDLEIATMRATYNDELTRDREAHAAKKAGPYALTNAMKSRKNQIESAIRKVVEVKEKADAERAEFIRSHDATGVKRFEEEIARIEAEIAKRKLIVGAAG
jgi:hypothetical protein